MAFVIFCSETRSCQYLETFGKPKTFDDEFDDVCISLFCVFIPIA